MTSLLDCHWNVMKIRSDISKVYFDFLRDSDFIIYYIFGNISYYKFECFAILLYRITPKVFMFFVFWWRIVNYCRAHLLVVTYNPSFPFPPIQSCTFEKIETSARGYFVPPFSYQCKLFFHVQKVKINGSEA